MVSEAVFFASMMQYLSITGEQDVEKAFNLSFKTASYCAEHYAELVPPLDDDALEFTINNIWKNAKCLSRSELDKRLRSAVGCSVLQATDYILRAQELKMISQVEIANSNAIYFSLNKDLKKRII